MEVCLDHAAECLAAQTPKEYVQQVAAAGEALRRARVIERKYGATQTGHELDELRRLMEPAERG